MDPTDTEFQALARLFMVQDTDRIIERMTCMDQVRRSENEAIWFNTNDELGAKLWDIEPLCQVAGICHDGGIILDGCHGISIRWKDFPRIYYQTVDSWQRRWISFRLRAGPVLFVVGAIIFGIEQHYRNRTKYLGAAIVGLSVLLSVHTMQKIPELYDGKIRKSQPWLLGFEGQLPLQEIEKTMFGNCIGRLRWSSSSSPFCAKSEEGRFGIEPHPLSFNIAPGYRIFTLVDTGNMSVTLFAAMKPPSVALICGKEGGMLRAVLCSYERSNNSFVKQCVLRMESPMLQKCEMMGWAKVE
ncbi:hypothetical protein VTL71DRAFT_1998 [Oculimacula yallundae]|uniref:Uncharacterized protein n=1 Tax=Oculimacula yallundae TaxID=86028 RepID=A0ABR4CC84_9HELO